MKETQIAEENVKKYNLFSNDNTLLCCQEHLATCQRFLEFLGELEGRWEPDGKKVNDKITDLQNAIKIYEDAGIK